MIRIILGWKQLPTIAVPLHHSHSSPPQPLLPTTATPPHSLCSGLEHGVTHTTLPLTEDSRGVQRLPI